MGVKYDAKKLRMQEMKTIKDSGETNARQTYSIPFFSDTFFLDAYDIVTLLVVKTIACRFSIFKWKSLPILNVHSTVYCLCV